MGGHSSFGEYLGKDGRSLLLGSVISVAIEFLLFGTYSVFPLFQPSNKTSRILYFTIISADDTGGYAILFAVCIYILVRQNKKSPARKINILLITTLFLIATVVTFLLVAETVTHLNSHIDCGRLRRMMHDHPHDNKDQIKDSMRGWGGGHHHRDESNKSPRSGAIFKFSVRKNNDSSHQGMSWSSGICGNSTAQDLDDPTTAGLKQANQIFFIIANMLGDGILIYRVYHIWDQSARVTYVPVVASVINNIIGLVTVGVNPSDGDGSIVKEAFYGLYLILNIVLNLFLTGLIAGRVWYIRRQAQLILKDAIKERYNTVIVVCVESGVLYPLFLIIFLSLELSISSLDFFPILVQAVGIAPTLITFRSSLGLSMDSVDQVVQSRLSNLPPGAEIRRGWGSARSVVVGEGGYSQGFFGYPFGQMESGLGRTEGRASSARNDERNSVR